MPTEKQLANLIPIKDTEIARQLQERSVKKRKENEPKRKALEQIKNEIIEKVFWLVYEKLESGDIEDNTLLQIFKSAIDMSGFKTNTQNITGNTNLTMQKVFVTKKDEKKVLKHIKDFING